MPLTQSLPSTNTRHAIMSIGKFRIPSVLPSINSKDLIGSWVGDGQRIPGVVCVFVFAPDQSLLCLAINVACPSIQYISTTLRNRALTSICSNVSKHVCSKLGLVCSGPLKPSVRDKTEGKQRRQEPRLQRSKRDRRRYHPKRNDAKQDWNG